MSIKSPIEYPKLKKVGGFQSFIQNTLIKILAITLIASLAGYLGGHTVQKSYRNLTGYTPEGQVVMEIEEAESDEDGVMTKIMNMAGAAKDTSVDLVYKAMNPPLRAMDWAAFWFSFALIFIVAAWLTNKLITLKSHVLSGSTDPQLIKNMELLEAKVKELVDNANSSR